MIINVIHPSYGRPELAYSRFNNVISNCSKTNLINYYMGLQTNDNKLDEYNNLIKDPMAYLYITDATCLVENLNNTVKNVNDGLIVVVADDLESPVNWDKLLVEKIKSSNLTGEYVIAVNDGIGDLITHPILSYDYYKRFNYIYYPGYKHFYGDTEFTNVSHINNKVIDAKDILFKHNHWSVSVAVKYDETYKSNKQYWQQDNRLYIARRQNNFK